MLKPSKEENLAGSLLVQGARVLTLLKHGSMTIDELRAAIPKKGDNPPAIDRTMDILTYLYLADLVIVNGVYIKLARTAI